MDRPDQETSPYQEKVVAINRLSKKTKGGNRISFSALVVVGDRKGKVGVALGKAPDVLSSIKKGIRYATKHLISVPIKGTTIPFAIEHKSGASKILLKPAPKGSGMIAGGSIRSVLELAGYRDVVGKILGSSNKIANVYTTKQALQKISMICQTKNLKFKSNLPKIEEKPRKDERPQRHQRHPKRASQKK